MFRTMMTGAVLLAAMALTGEAAAISCDSELGQPLPVRTTPVPPLYSGMLGRPAALAAPRTLLAESRDESLALDVVLMRLRLEACAAQPKDEFANYVPKTEFDNTPYRFNMDKGKKFTAAEFDAWMKSRGVRVVQARPAAAGATPAAAIEAAAPQTATVAD
ncbi:MAG: hypothetical protein RBT79_01225 [Chiayiivirga sp.]|jgi:hypothetical protein|uniref:Secreted protein n=2 Tax=Denitratimonas tolerans TaxID=1338420 RepID=A0AAW9RAU3_9GAMM|nr:hypothetical protein [Chiayiivirga sp.]